MDQTAAGTWALVIVAFFAASVAYRWWSRKGVFARPHPHAAFVERWASARSGSGMLARLSTGKNCLQVQVAERELVVTPHFPFTLGFVPEVYDMDKRIPAQRVRRAVVLGGSRTNAVEVTYLRPDGDEAVLQLLLRGGDAFVAALMAAHDAQDHP